MSNTAMQIDKNEIIHIPVMSEEIGNWLQPREGGTYLDATLGFGGHTFEILRRSNFNSRVIAMDVDKEAINYSRAYLSEYADNIVFINRNFSNIDEVAGNLGIEKFDGIVADLGMSSYQIESSGKGFSFMKSEYLDMRMDPQGKITASDILNNRSFDELVRIFRDYGEERFASRIAAQLIKTRESRQIRFATQLSEIIENSIPVKFHPKHIHPATRIFQALRIAVNNELENLEKFIQKAVSLLAHGSRIAIISFHSIEDRIVKNKFRSFSENCVCPPELPVCGCGKKQELVLLTRKSIKPSPVEVEYNRRSRSARLRVAEKV